MAGLLDWMGTPEGQGLLSAAFGGFAGARRGQPLNSLGRAGLSGLSGYADATDRQTQADQLAKRNELFDMQLAQMRQAQTDAQLARDNEATFRSSIASPQQQADVNNALTPAQFGAVAPTLGLFGAGPVEGGTGLTAGRVTPPKPVNREEQQLYRAFQLGLVKPMDYLAATNKAPTTFKLADGESLYRQNEAGGFDSVVAGKPKASDETSDVRNYQFAVGQGYRGSFTQYQLDQRKAGASNVNVPVNTGQKGLDNTLKVRSDFRAEPIYKAHQDVQAAYSQITQSLKMASPAGDLAGATKFMKILDPGSVVRESELGMAMAATGLLDRLQNYASMVVNGTKLTPTQRADFQSLSDSLFEQSQTQYNNKRAEYQGLAERNGLNTMDVLGPEPKLTRGGGWEIMKPPGR